MLRWLFLALAAMLASFWGYAESVAGVPAWGAAVMAGCAFAGVATVILVRP